MKNKLRKIRECAPYWPKFDREVHNLCSDGKYLFAVQRICTKERPYTPEYGNNLMIDFHFHKVYELEIILFGEIKNICNDRTENIKPNGFYIMSPNNIHAKSFADESDVVILLNIAFDEVILSDSMKKILKRRKLPMSGTVSDEFLKYFGTTIEKLSKLKKTMPNEESYNEMLYKMFEALLIYLVNLSNGEKDEKNTVRSEEKSHMYEAIKYVREHYKEKITISELAKKYGYSTNYFGSKFKETTNKTFVEYVTDLRMVEAYKRILSSDDPIYNISSEVGYSNLTYFYKKFKEKFGYLPEEVRKYKQIE